MISTDKCSLMKMALMKKNFCRSQNCRYPCIWTTTLKLKIGLFHKFYVMNQKFFMKCSNVWILKGNIFYHINSYKILFEIFPTKQKSPCKRPCHRKFWKKNIYSWTWQILKYYSYCLWNILKYHLITNNVNIPLLWF